MIIDYDGIYRIAQQVKREFSDRFPRSSIDNEYDALCKMKKLTIKGLDTQYSVQEFKAMYCYEVGRNIVIYNKKLRGRLRLVVILHELGHKLLHWRIIRAVGHCDRDIFGMNSQLEIEANVFVVEMLLDDSEVLELLTEDGLTFSQIAQQLEVPEEFLAFKCRSMNHRLDVRINIPCNVHGNCLKKMDNDDYDE